MPGIERKGLPEASRFPEKTGRGALFGSRDENHGLSPKNESAETERLLPRLKSLNETVQLTLCMSSFVFSRIRGLQERPPTGLTPGRSPFQQEKKSGLDLIGFLMNPLRPARRIFGSMGSGESTCWTMVTAAAEGDQHARVQFTDIYLDVVRCYLAARWRDRSSIAE